MECWSVGVMEWGDFPPKTPALQYSNTPTLHSAPMGSLKKRRKSKINKHKRRKQLRANRHKKRTWQK